MCIVVVMAKGLVTLFTIGLVTSLLGQSDDPVSVGYIHKFKGDLDGGGDVTFDRYYAKVGALLHQDDDLFVALGAGYVVDRHDFAPIWDAWGTIRHATLSTPIRWKMNDSWTWSSVVSVGSSAESGADRGDSYNWSLVTSWDYKYSDTLSFGPGFSYVDEIEDSASIFPIVSLRWQMTDRLLLSTGPTEGVNSGANVFVRYDYDDKWGFTGGISYTNSRFRLSRNNWMQPNGVGEESYGVVYGIAKYRAAETLSVSFIAGYMFTGEYVVHDSNGNETGTRDTDAAPVLGVSLNYEF